MSVSLRQLSVFRTLMQTLSVTETASRLRITQPAVSKTLAQLEDSLGLVLFHRSRGRLHPGSDAERLYVEATRLHQDESEEGPVPARSGHRIGVETFNGPQGDAGR